MPGRKSTIYAISRFYPDVRKETGNYGHWSTPYTAVPKNADHAQPFAQYRGHFFILTNFIT